RSSLPSLPTRRSSDLNVHERMRVVKDTLATLGLATRPQLLVLNKADALRGPEGDALREALGGEFPKALLVSGRTGEGIDALRGRSEEHTSELQSLRHL